METYPVVRADWPLVFPQKTYDTPRARLLWFYYLSEFRKQFSPSLLSPLGSRAAK